MKTKTDFFVSNIHYFFVLTCLLFSSCATVPVAQRMDNLPMYGQPEIPRPEYFQEGDRDFIKKAASGFGGDRKIASIAWSKAGDDFFNEGNLHYAMRRYNQSWLLNPDNYLAYWGFGGVMLARGKINQNFNESIKYFEKSKKLIDDPYQKVALLADTGVAYSYKADSISADFPQERAKFFAMANDNFQKSIALEKQYENCWRQWAYSLFREGKYEEVWEKIKMVRSLGGRPFPESFLNELKGKSPNNQ